MAQIQLNEQAIQRIVLAEEGPVGRLLLRLANQVANESLNIIRRQAFDTGALLLSIKVQQVPGRVFVYSDLPYAPFVERGTRGRPGVHFLSGALSRVIRR